MVGVAARAAHSGNNWWSPVLGDSLLHQTSETTLELLAARGISHAIENPRSIRDRYRFHCPLPGHTNDTHPSFSIHSDGIQWHCFPCNTGGGPRQLIKLLGGSDLVLRKPKTYNAPAKSKPAKPEERPTGCTLEQLASAKYSTLPKYIILEHLRRLGWYDTQRDGIPTVGIPYPNGSLRYRVGLTGKSRFKWKKDSKVDLYGTDWLQNTDQIVLVVEGETDTAAATLLGIPTMGVPGVGTWKSEWAKVLLGRDVILWQEPGAAGQNLVDAIAQDIPNLKVIKAPDGVKDVCELLDQAGSGAAEFLQELVSEAEPYHPALDDEEDVPNRERNNNNKVLFHIRDRSALWASTKELFPLPTGTKPWVVGRVLYNRQDRKAVVCDFLSNSWRNPANAQHKRRCLFFNLLPRINGTQVYELKVAFDDWNPLLHDTIRKRIQRAMAKYGNGDFGWIWFDNIMERGYCLYLTNTPGVSGFEAVDDVEAVLVEALKAIHPPSKEEPGRFRPYGGSDSWTSRVEGTGERDRGKWDIIAVSDRPADFVQIEAECIAADIPHETTRPYWRAQVGDGLEMRMSFEEAMQLSSSLGYSPTRAGRLGLVDSDGDISESMERIKAFATTSDAPSSEAWIEGVL